MRNKILMYLFIFTLLFAIFIYVNDKRILDSKENEITSLKNRLQESEIYMDSLSTVPQEDYFNLENNEEALSYFEEKGIDTRNLVSRIEDAIISKNKVGEDNPYVPYDGMDGDMKINKIKVLNHKWLIADFTDGTYWGEVFLYYEIGEDGEINFTPEKSFLYPVN